jgi:hypothetical protein
MWYVGARTNPASHELRNMPTFTAVSHVVAVVDLEAAITFYRTYA